MPVSAPKPVDIACLLLVAKARRERLRARCPGDRFRAAMAILKQEKERMRGKWSLDSVYEWPDDGDETHATAGSSAPAVEPLDVGACGFPPPHIEGRSAAQPPGGEMCSARSASGLGLALEDRSRSEQSTQAKTPLPAAERPTSPRRAGVAIDFGTWGLVCFSHPFPDREARMPTPTIEYATDAERLLLERAVAYFADLRALAHTAPHGTVIDACEALAPTGGRRLLRDSLARAVQARLDTADAKNKSPASAARAAARGTS